MPATSLGDRLRSLRVDRGWRQVDAARYARVPKAWYAAVEAGDIRNPPWDRLEKLAAAFGVSARFLATGRGEPEPEQLIEAPRPLSPEDRGQTFAWWALTPRMRRRLLAIADTLRKEIPDDDDGEQGEERQPARRR